MRPPQFSPPPPGDHRHRHHHHHHHHNDRDDDHDDCDDDNFVDGGNQLSLFGAAKTIFTPFSSFVRHVHQHRYHYLDLHEHGNNDNRDHFRIAKTPFEGSLPRAHPRADEEQNRGHHQTDHVSAS